MKDHQFSQVIDNSADFQRIRQAVEAIFTAQEKTRLAAFFYRREAVAYREAMEMVLAESKKTLRLKDRINNLAKVQIETLEELDDKDVAEMRTLAKREINRLVKMELEAAARRIKKAGRSKKAGEVK